MGILFPFAGDKIRAFLFPIYQILSLLLRSVFWDAHGTWMVSAPSSVVDRDAHEVHVDFEQVPSVGKTIKAQLLMLLHCCTGEVLRSQFDDTQSMVHQFGTHNPHACQPLHAVADCPTAYPMFPGLAWLPVQSKRILTV